MAKRRKTTKKLTAAQQAQREEVIASMFREVSSLLNNAMARPVDIRAYMADPALIWADLVVEGK